MRASKEDVSRLDVVRLGLMCQRRQRPLSLRTRAPDQGAVTYRQSALAIYVRAGGVKAFCSFCPLQSSFAGYKLRRRTVMLS